MSDNKIHIPVKRWLPLQPGRLPVTKLTVEAYDVLVEICNKSGQSMKDVASQIITQGAQMIEYDKEN